MKSIRSSPVSENKTNEISIADLSRVKLPRLQNPIKKVKKNIVKASNRIDKSPSKYDPYIEEVLDSHNRKYNKSRKNDCYSFLQKSITCINQNTPLINRNIDIKSAKEPIIRRTSSSETHDPIFPTKLEIIKWTKRLQFRKRQEMEKKNLIVINFEGVLGDIFKDNIWENQEEKLYMRKDAIKGLKELMNQLEMARLF